MSTDINETPIDQRVKEFIWGYNERLSDLMAPAFQVEGVSELPEDEYRKRMWFDPYSSTYPSPPTAADTTISAFHDESNGKDADVLFEYTEAFDQFTGDKAPMYQIYCHLRKNFGEVVTSNASSVLKPLEHAIALQLAQELNFDFGLPQANQQEMFDFIAGTSLKVQCFWKDLGEQFNDDNLIQRTGSYIQDTFDFSEFLEFNVLPYGEVNVRFYLEHNPNHPIAIEDTDDEAIKLALDAKDAKTLDGVVTELDELEQEREIGTQTYTNKALTRMETGDQTLLVELFYPRRLLEQQVMQTSSGRVITAKFRHATELQTQKIAHRLSSKGTSRKNILQVRIEADSSFDRYTFLIEALHSTLGISRWLNNLDNSFSNINENVLDIYQKYSDWGKDSVLAVQKDFTATHLMIQQNLSTNERKDLIYEVFAHDLDEEVTHELAERFLTSLGELSPDVASYRPKLREAVKAIIDDDFNGNVKDFVWSLRTDTSNFLTMLQAKLL